jgi:hypothetical protein
MMLSIKAKDDPTATFGKENLSFDATIDLITSPFYVKHLKHSKYAKFFLYTAKRSRNPLWP